MVSDQEIASCVASILGSATTTSGDGSTAITTEAAGSASPTLASVLRQAQSELGVDLSHKASLIRDQMDLLLGPRIVSPPPSFKSHPFHSPQPQKQESGQSLQLQSQPQSQLSPSVHVPFPQRAQMPMQGMPQMMFHQIPHSHPIPPSITMAAPGGPGSVPQPTMAFYPPPPLAFRYLNQVQLQATASGATAGHNLPSIPTTSPGGVSYQQKLQLPPPAAGTSGESSSVLAKRKRGGPGGLNKVCGISPQLQTILGQTAMSRTQIVKQLWAYIRMNNLQDPDDKRKIICNEELKVLFGTDSTDMFKMNKLLAKHIIPLDPRGQKKVKASDVVPETNSDDSRASIVVSDALAKFIGTEEREMLPDDALKHVLTYINANQLEDTVNSSILCDLKLQELFGRERLAISELSEMLSGHFVKS